MLIRILYHDHCFDGAASAALFSRFIETNFHPGARFEFTGMAHKASQLFEDELFDGDVNAIVDFKYSPHPKLTWWFDHHQSAFLSPEDQKHFEADKGGRKFFDPTYRSCTMYIADVAKTRFGFSDPTLAELIEWADIIDGAQYESPKAAVELGRSAMKLTLVIEGSKGSEVVQHIIRAMRTRRLDDIIDDPLVQAQWGPLYERHLRSIDVIRDQSSHDRGVVYFDLIEQGLDGYNKFIPYYLHPDSVYTVSVSNQSFRTKVSVGSNPWVTGPLKHNIATICERYGGGGHPRVGAISFEKGDVASARRAAAEISAELKS